jgi:hypothetical protein
LENETPENGEEVQPFEDELEKESKPIHMVAEESTEDSHGKVEAGEQGPAVEDMWPSMPQSANAPALGSVNQLQTKLVELGGDHGHEFYVCGGCGGVFIDLKPTQCVCGNIVDTAFYKYE